MSCFFTRVSIVYTSNQSSVSVSVDGFLFLLIGTALYNQLIDVRNFVPCIKFDTEELKDLPSSSHSNIQDVSYSDEDTDNERTKLLKGKR